MKIDNSVKIDSSVKPVVNQTGGVRTSSAKAGVSTRSAASGGAEVALSPLSSRLQQIESSLASSPATNADRVAEIRQAIAQGSFKIDTGKIADGLIESVRQMLVAQR
ncbi:MAG: flagellar biosynthesis anti-sigma factor FlgM [Sterolibacterium sp.]